jgi:transposase-like protein
MSGAQRRRFSNEQKFKIVKEALTTDLGVSEVCKKYGIHASQFYRWQEVFFEGALENFNRAKDGLTVAEKRALDGLKKENVRLKDVVAEVLTENIDLKKRTGGL